MKRLSLIIKQKAKHGNFIEQPDLYSTDSRKMIPVNRKVTVLSFAPPLSFGKNKGESRCILCTMPADTWYKNFRINHYYIFYLEVKG